MDDCVRTAQGVEIEFQQEWDANHVVKDPNKFCAEAGEVAAIRARNVYVPSKNSEEGYFFEAMAADEAFGALLHPGSGRQILSMVENFTNYGGFGVMLVDEPEETNRIFINPQTDKVDVAYTLSDDSVKRLNEGLKTGLRIAFKASAERVELLSSEPLLSNEVVYFPLSDINQVEDAVNHMRFIPSQNFLSSAHLFIKWCCSST